MSDCLPLKIEHLQTPALVIYKHIVTENAQQMIQRAEEFGVNLRPHFKTTKCVEAAMIQTNGEKQCMVVSTIPEAELLHAHGFSDILYGVPLSESRVDRCAALNENMDKFSVFIDREDMVPVLEKHKIKKQWSVFIEIDCNNKRSGILYSDSKAVSLVQKVVDSPDINFRGLYAHCGNSYGADSLKHVHAVAIETTNNLLSLVSYLKKLGIPCPTYGIGSTPTCSNPHPIMKQLTEWHPGNYVLYDVMQVSFQFVKFSVIATSALCHCSTILKLGL